MRSLITAAAIFGGILSAAARPPDPSDPSTWGTPEPLPADETETLTPRQLKMAEIAARTAARQAALDAMPVYTQKMQRVRGVLLAGIETDPKTGAKTAKIVRPDGSIEIRPLKVLATARIQPKKPEKEKNPLDGSHAASGAAGAVLGAAAALALKKTSAPGGAGPG
jgi:hypothetical protein